MGLLSNHASMIVIILQAQDATYNETSKGIYPVYDVVSSTGPTKAEEKSKQPFFYFTYCCMLLGCSCEWPCAVVADHV